ncbi:MAG: flavoprotein, partial [Gemmatimonadota bacterium]
MRPFDGRRILLGVTGGIASYKTAWLARLLTQAGAQVDVVMTRSAKEFIG